MTCSKYKIDRSYCNACSNILSEISLLNILPSKDKTIQEAGSVLYIFNYISNQSITIMTEGNAL